MLQESYGKHCVPLVVPVGEAADLSAVVNIVNGDTSAVADMVESLKEGMIGSGGGNR